MGQRFQSLAGSSRRPLPRLAAALLIVAAIALGYHNSLRVPLLLDDDAAITANPSLKNLRNLGAVFDPPEHAPTAGRPLLNLSFALNYAWGGAEVASYHVVNVLLHAAAALTLFGLVRRTLRTGRAGERLRASADWVALAATVVWAVHPVHTASVTYISQRAELLMALFFLLTLYAWARGAESGRSGWRWAAVAACAAGMMSKETMVTAPVVVLLYDRVFFAEGFGAALRKRRAQYASLGATWLLLGVLMWSTRVTSRGIGFAPEMQAWTYALTQCRVVVDYLQLTWWPHPLVFDHGPEIAVRSLAEVRPHLALLLGLLAAMVLGARRVPAAAFTAGLFFIVLAPTSSVVPVTNQPMAENRIYLPSAAAAVLTISLAWRFLTFRVAALASAGVAVAFTALTVLRNQVYQDPVALWSDTVARRPENVRARSHLGETLRASGNTAAAIEQFKAALRLNASYVAAHNNLGLIYTADPAAWPEAIRHFETALRVQPKSAHVHNNLAVVLQRIPGREAEAIGHFREAIRLAPDYADAHKNLANVLIQQPGGAAEAVREYAEALRLMPNDAGAHANYAFALAVTGRTAEAIRHCETALRLNPQHAPAHLTYANLLRRVPGRLPDAIAHYRRAIAIQPEFAEAWANLGAVLLDLPNARDEGVAALKEALRLRPDLVAAQKALERAEQVNRDDRR